MRKKEQEIQYLLDALILAVERDTLDDDSRTDFGGQIRGVASALAILRGTSAKEETVNAMKRVGVAGKGWGDD